jgi:S-formylglutathione hydrolase
MLLGASMGGYGALKMAFAEPERYLAVATMAPAIFPGETLADIDPTNAPGVLGELRDAMAASGYLHRVLWDLGIDHDYHLVQGADHAGSQVEERAARAREFLARALQRGQRG